MATTFEGFCRHYDLNPKAATTRRDYEAYLLNLSVFKRLIAKPEPAGKQAERKAA